MRFRANLYLHDIQSEARQMEKMINQDSLAPVEQNIRNRVIRENLGNLRELMTKLESVIEAAI